MSFVPLSKQSEDRLRNFYYSGNTFGRDKLYYSFKQKYPEDTSSRRAIWSFLEKQEVHQIYQRPTLKRGIVRPMVAEKLGSIQLDYMDFSSMPYNGFDSVCNAVDIFSKKYYAFACKGQTVKNTIKAMETFLRMGMKVTFLQADNGTSFKGDFPDWCKDNNITLQHSKPHSPWSNGVIESKGGAFKRNLFQTLKSKGTNNWVDILPQIVSNINNTMTFATGKSPNDIEENEEIHSEVGTRLKATASKRYKQKSTAADLQVGDWVRRKVDYDPANIKKATKTGYWRKEIYEIIAVVKNRKIPNVLDSYRIKVQDGEILKGLFPRSDLLLIPKEMDKIPEQVVRPGPEEGTTDKYEVESILDKRKGRGKQVF